MTPEAMAALHAACFTTPRPWTAEEFTALLSGPGVFALTEGDEALLLGRVVADEAELLTLAVAPRARRHGIGLRMVARFAAEAARQGARVAFLEVSAKNGAARALYRAFGFVETGLRKGYYHGPGTTEDAVIMGCAFELAGDLPAARADRPIS